MKNIKKENNKEKKILQWFYKNNLTNFIILLGVGNFFWLTRQSYIDYQWLIHHTFPLKPIDFLILCGVVPLHWVIVTFVLFLHFVKHDNQIPYSLRYLFLLDVFYIAFRMHADMITAESMTMHYIISFINVVVLCGFNWACFYNCITPKMKDQ